jgi:putative glutamine amidotransferase
MKDGQPLIGVPTQTLQAIDGIPPELPESWVMNQRYLLALASVDALPVLLPLLTDDDDTLRGIYDRLDGIFLAGGVDMDPESYREARHGLCGRTDPARDRVEIRLATWAAAEGKPVLGVCRGMQVLNVAAGGSLLQDCDAFHTEAIKHDYFPTAGHARDYLAHAVTLAPGSRLARLLGGPKAMVNSMHHQGIRALGDGLVPTAFAPDGLIEGLEANGDAFLVGVQWHPEMLIDRDAGTRRLFEAFVEAAGAWRERNETVRSAGAAG